MRTIILLNGPPRCGKDTIARFLVEEFGATHEKFAAPIITAAAALYDFYPSDYDELKTRDSAGFNVREATIALGEETKTRTHHAGWFGCLLGRRLRETPASLIVVSDLGFYAELRALEDAIKASGDELHVWTIHRTGCTFATDSRNWVGHDSVTVFDNNGDLRLLNEKVLSAMRNLDIPKTREPVCTTTELSNRLRHINSELAMLRDQLESDTGDKEFVLRAQRTDELKDLAGSLRRQLRTSNQD